MCMQVFTPCPVKQIFLNILKGQAPTFFFFLPERLILLPVVLFLSRDPLKEGFFYCCFLIKAWDFWITLNVWLAGEIANLRVTNSTFRGCLIMH